MGDRDDLARELDAAARDLELTEVAAALTVLAHNSRAALRAADRRQLRRAAGGAWETRCSSAVPWTPLAAPPTEHDVAAQLGGAPWRVVPLA